MDKQTQDAANQLDDARHKGAVLLFVDPLSVAARVLQVERDDDYASTTETIPTLRNLRILRKQRHEELDKEDEQIVRLFAVGRFIQCAKHAFENRLHLLGSALVGLGETDLGKRFQLPNHLPFHPIYRGAFFVSLKNPIYTGLHGKQRIATHTVTSSRIESYAFAERS